MTGGEKGKPEHRKVMAGKQGCLWRGGRILNVVAWLELRSFACGEVVIWRPGEGGLDGGGGKCGLVAGIIHENANHLPPKEKKLSLRESAAERVEWGEKVFRFMVDEGEGDERRWVGGGS